MEGRVKINHEVCRELGTKIDPDKDRIEVDGRLINLPETHVYILLNKPQGYITSMHDPEGRPIITDLLPQNMPRIWPVGRLDWNSEGLILLTNDGKLTHLLTHPTHHVPKHYAVKVQGRLESDDPKLKQLMEGVEIDEDGEPTRPAFMQVSRVDRNSWLEVIIAEGRNRQIRRMFEMIGHPVMKLRRIGIGPLTIEGLRSGTFRSLHSAEVVALYEALDALIPAEAQPTQRQLRREQQEQEAGKLQTHSVKPARGGKGGKSVDKKRARGGRTSDDARSPSARHNARPSRDARVETRRSASSSEPTRQEAPSQEGGYEDYGSSHDQRGRRQAGRGQRRDGAQGSNRNRDDRSPGRGERSPRAQAQSAQASQDRGAASSAGPRWSSGQHQPKAATPASNSGATAKPGQRPGPSKGGPKGAPGKAAPRGGAQGKPSGGARGPQQGPKGSKGSSQGKPSAPSKSSRGQGKGKKK